MRNKSMVPVVLVAVAVVLIGLILMGACVAVTALLFMHAWNFVVPPTFAGVQELNFW